MVPYFFRTSVRGELWIRRAFLAALILIGATLFTALVFPFSALFTLAVGGVVYRVLKYLYGPSKGPTRRILHSTATAS